MFGLSVFCRAYGLDSDSALNLYITTLLLQENADNKHYEVGAGDFGPAEGDEGTGVGHEDVLERVQLIVPQLSSTADLVISLHTALTKVRLARNTQVKRLQNTVACLYLPDQCGDVEIRCSIFIYFVCFGRS